MKKNHLLVLVIFVVIGFAATFAYGLIQMPSQPLKQTSKQQIYNVSILKDKAVPDFVTIHPGEYVQFNSKDGNEHILAQGHGSGFGDLHEHFPGGESPIIHADEGYKVLFKTVGTYDFHDHENEEIHVTVLVYKESDKK